MYVVLGATGHTGSVVAAKLLEAGRKVRAVARDGRKLASLAKKGAELAALDITDTDALSKAFDGAEAVYALIPPNPASNDYRQFQDKAILSLAKSIEQAGVQYAVTLSSFGADKPDKTGPVVGLHKMEERLGGIDWLNVVHLRAGYFMENTLPQVDVIRQFDRMAGPLKEDLPIPMIAAKDIGAVAADTLVRLDFKGKQTRELLGQRDITYKEGAKIAGAAIRKSELRYAQIPATQMIEALTAMGMSQNFTELLLEMSDAMNSGYMKALEPRSPKNTTPTSYEAWVDEVFVPVYKGQAAAAR